MTEKNDISEPVRDACGVGFLAERSGQSGTRVLPLALTALGRMVHRGAVDADGRTGDGAGIMTQIPFAVLKRDVEFLGIPCVPGELAVGLVFLPRGAQASRDARAAVECALAEHGLPRCAWRTVPVNVSALGSKAEIYRPTIEHLVVQRPAGLAADAFEACLATVRHAIEMRAHADLYIASLSHRTLVYKALVRATDLRNFYPDLRKIEYETSFALFHQRFSTNTSPSWSMTQPFRFVAHNGEINTIDGNRRWMQARAGERPVSSGAGKSDSASLDDALAGLVQSGHEIARGLSLLIPPAWEHSGKMSPDVRAFFDHQASMMEPWDGPALVAFSDGRVVGAALDRNGLRPARYLVTSDDLVLVASEVGVLDVDDARVVMRGRLGPGDVLLVNLETGGLFDRDAIHARLAGQHAYAVWTASRRIALATVRAEASAVEPAEMVDVRVLRAAGCTREELLLVLGPMHSEGIEPLGSMGDDSPLAVLSNEPRTLFSYFRQRFAQVTNPPIDSLRETLVMSADVRLGPAGQLAKDAPLPAHHVYCESAILEPGDVNALLSWTHPTWRARRLSLLTLVEHGEQGFTIALDRLVAAAQEQVRAGAPCLVLSDDRVDAGHASLPTLLAVAAVHQHLVAGGLRLSTSIVVDAGDARDEHAIAALLAFGADAVCPRLGYAAIAFGIDSSPHDVDIDAHTSRYRKALEKGLLKILAKMGISTLRSYRGAGLFEAIGIGADVIAQYFPGTHSPIGGIGICEIARETLERHRAAFAEGVTALTDGGWHRYRKDGESHAYEPKVIKALHGAIRTGTRLDYRSYADLVHARAPLAIRDLLEFRTSPCRPAEFCRPERSEGHVPRPDCRPERSEGPAPLSLDDVEPVEDILPRFMSAAMSLGSLSPEAQQTIAIAMNRMGARSNSGEGGESPELFWSAKPGADRASARIKQIASGRFGVTAAYLMSADELQIKMAQGSKPGEGGQLPGAKVTEHIARVRNAAPGTTLISPPPHHDIYSIEDLAQLIYDLKTVNPAAMVSVKLVSSSGIGTIAVGVVKAFADAIQISGHDGGTGASPRGSIKNAGSPWELGLNEAHRALVRGGLRGRVRLQVDGGFKTGRDVVIAAMLGAEEFGFGTAALVAAGCLMARQCHLNSCPVGIATQREDLRKKFAGTPDDVIRLFVAIAEEVREILAMLGVARLADIIGRADLLEQKLIAHGKASTVRLDVLLAGGTAERCRQSRNDPPRTGSGIDARVLRALRFESGEAEPIDLLLPITNADRAVGAGVAGELVLQSHGGRTLPRAVHLHFLGSAGQSFGAFCVNGMRLVLDGEANDFVGKGMSGGEIVVRPPASRRHTTDQVIAGNTLLYGATGGTVFIAGRVGERFAVRNSGATAVVEGTGDHAGEYMTAGTLVILGPVGQNLGAGMTGGLIYALDVEHSLERSIHADWVRIEPELTDEDEHHVRDLIVRHLRATGSRAAEQLTAEWSTRKHRIRRIAPRALESTAAVQHTKKAAVSRSN